jgi:hypothetical protein
LRHDLDGAGRGHVPGAGRVGVERAALSVDADPFAATPPNGTIAGSREHACGEVQCTKCGGRLRVVGFVMDAALVRSVLEQLGMAAEAPRVARARDPTGDAMRKELVAWIFPM